MKIELRERIKVTEEELSKIQAVSNDRPSLSETLIKKPKPSRASYYPVTQSFEDFMESIHD